jgi:hypothetical protein
VLTGDRAAGADAQLQVVYRTPRYVLVKVPTGYRVSDPTADQLAGAS